MVKHSKIYASYDAIVIGGGSGLKLAHLISENGYRVALIEKAKMGGTCLNRGCIPSKMLIHSAELALQLRRLHLFNLQIDRWNCAFSELVKRVSRKVSKKQEVILNENKKSKNLTLFQEDAFFLSKSQISVGNKIIAADKIFLSVGARPRIPNIPGLEGTPYMVSDDVFQNKKKPKSLIIIGGGYIAAELGFFYAALGTEVTLLIRRTSMLPKEDCLIQSEFPKVFGKYCNLLFGSVVSLVTYKNNKFQLIYTRNQKKQKISSDSLLIATGLQPWSDHLKLENTSIKTDKNGFIKVDSFLKTHEKNIWAFGDCIGKNCFKHMANYEADYLFRLLFENKQSEPISYPMIPHAIYTYPSIAGVGKTEQELKKEKIPYYTGFCSYKDTARSLATLPEKGFVKLLFSKETNQLVGAHILGDNADIMIHVLMVFFQKKATVEEIKDMIYIHPSLPEAIRNAARDAYSKTK